MVQEWNQEMSINLKADFLSTREALRRMSGQSYSCIINNSAKKGV